MENSRKSPRGSKSSRSRSRSPSSRSRSPVPSRSRSRSPSPPPRLSLLESLPDELLLRVMNFMNPRHQTITKRVSQRFNLFNPARPEMNSIKRKLKNMGLLLLTGRFYTDLNLNENPITIIAKDRNHQSTIRMLKKNNEIVYETEGDYEEEIDKSLLYLTEDISISHYIQLISTLLDLYPNGQIEILVDVMDKGRKIRTERNKIDLLYEPVQLGIILAKGNFSQLDLKDDIVDGFLYNTFVFDEYQRILREIPANIIADLDELF
jgi:hypothetical protein